MVKTTHNSKPTSKIIEKVKMSRQFPLGVKGSWYLVWLNYQGKDILVRGESIFVKQGE
jgi:hypothetical protein